MSYTFERIKINAAPPVASRPKCPQCGKPLRPYWETASEQRTGSGSITREKWRGQYHGYGAFDTMRCAVDYANRVVRSRRAAAP